MYISIKSLCCVPETNIILCQLFFIKKQFLFFNYLLFKSFIYLFWEREREGESEREEKRESQAGFVLTMQSLMWGLISWTVRLWSEPKSRVRCLTNWATQVPVGYFNRVIFLTNLHIKKWNIYFIMPNKILLSTWPSVKNSKYWWNS